MPRRAAIRHSSRPDWSDAPEALAAEYSTVFAAPVYLRGFIRTYAKLLQLDADKLLQQLNDETGADGAAGSESSAVPSRLGFVDALRLRLSRLNWLLIAVIVALVLLLALATWGWRAWDEHRQRDPLKNLGSPLNDTAPRPAPGTLPLPTNAPRRAP